MTDFEKMKKQVEEEDRQLRRKLRTIRNVLQTAILWLFITIFLLVISLLYESPMLERMLDLVLYIGNAVAFCIGLFTMIIWYARKRKSMFFVGLFITVLNAYQIVKFLS